MKNKPDNQYRVELHEILEEVRTEILETRQHHSQFASTHEGYAVILEELDELWDEVKANNKEAAKYEAIQVAAMAIAFILEV